MPLIYFQQGFFREALNSLSFFQLFFFTLLEINLLMRQLIHKWNALWDPDRYHGWGKTSNYFEGWYFKIVDPTEQHILAVIPGISLGKDGEQHAFIQVLDGVNSTSSYHKFKAAQFIPSTNKFAVRIEENYFSREEINLNLPNLKGNLKFESHYPWPKMLGAPGIMGWYSFVPFMQCYHGVVSMDHNILGSLSINEKPINFSEGRGYMEKDWGRSFPNAWIWMQSNHFDSDKRVSLMASVANIPWLGSHFVGYIVGFLMSGKLYRFATYTGAKMKASHDSNIVYLTFYDKKNRLEIKATQARGGDLVAPISGNMTGKVNESMQAILEVNLYERNKLIFKGTGKNAGMEVAGKAETLWEKKS